MNIFDSLMDIFDEKNKDIYVEKRIACFQSCTSYFFAYYL